MDSRSRQKGFTTVELVIVMAVIAILATVLIPTFSNLITQAEEAAALQEASSILRSYFIDKADDTAAERDFYIHAKGYYFRVIDGQLQKDGDPAAPAEIGAIILSASPDAPYYEAEAVTAPEANGEANETPNAPENSGEQDSEDTPKHDYPCYDEVGMDFRCDECGKHVHDQDSYNADYDWCLYCKP